MTSETSASGARRRRFGYRMNATGMLSVAIILFWAAIALFAPWLAPHPTGDIVDSDFYGPISRALPFGSDYLGRDMLSRILVGARFTLGISLASTLIAVIAGVILGMSAAVAGGWFDAILSRFFDALISIPSKLLGLVIVAAVGSSIPVLIVTMGIIYIPGAYRFARSLAVNVNTQDFVTVARVRGENILYIIGYEILPNIIRPVLADFGVRFVFVVLLLSGLSFLGLGLQPPHADWGALVRENIGGLAYGAPAVIFPSLAIATLTISVNLFIDNLPQKIRDRNVP